MHLSDTAPHNDPDLPSPPDSGNVPRPAGRSGRKLAFDKHDLNTRLQQLAAEWDVERIIETEAPLTILAGIAAGALLDRRLVAVSGVSAGMLALHCLRGSYPLLPLFHLAGARTTREIAAEMYALKQRRGDFASLDNAATEEERAAAAYDAAALC